MATAAAAAVVDREGETTEGGGGRANALRPPRAGRRKGGRGAEGRLVRIEARTGREDSGLAQAWRRDNGSNELTRTPEPPRLFLPPSCPLAPRRIIVFLLSLSLARLLDPSLRPRSFPPAPSSLRRVSHSFSSFCTTAPPPPSPPLSPSSRILSAIFVPSLLAVLSFSLALSLSLSLFRLEIACARTYSRSLPLRLFFSCFRAGLGAANYPGYFLLE